MDPLDAAEEIFKATEQELLEEQIKIHAETILIGSIASKPLIQGHLLFKAQEQGPEYMTGLLVAVGLTARGWGRVLAEDASLDFTKYINPEAETFCSGSEDDSFAHYAVREILNVETVAQADKIRLEIMTFTDAHDFLMCGRMHVHLVGLFGELVRAVLDIRNGDYTPGDGDDR